MLSALPLVLAALAPVVQPVGEYERWQLSFDAKVEGEHVIENYPQYAKLFFCGPSVARYYGQPLANWEVRFTDAAGKPVNQAANWGAFYRTVFSSEMHTYRDEFIVPPGGVQVEIRFNPPDAKDALTVENVRLSKVENPPTLNVNPDFALGPRCFAGWNVGSNRRIVKDPENAGRYLLVAGSDAGNGSLRSDWVPVTPGEKVRFEYRMRSSLTNGAGRVVFMTYKSTAQRDDCQSGTLSKSFYIGRKWTEGSFDFVVPAETRIIRIYADNTTFAFARFVKVEEADR